MVGFLERQEAILVLDHCVLLGQNRRVLTEHGVLSALGLCAASRQRTDGAGRLQATAELSVDSSATLRQILSLIVE